jgi:hypothetical protein
MTKNKYQSIYKTTNINGKSISIFSALILLSAIFSYNWVGILISTLIICSGLTELYGRKLLMAKNPLAAILLIIWIYSTIQYMAFDAVEAMTMLSPQSLDMVRLMVANEEEFVSLVGTIWHTTYIVAMLVTAVYQGGLGIYYYKGSRYLLANPEE